ncbi:MAG: hypothetical protein CMN76_00780 [Spirochaetaceae bacterium]|nr:hypothetical protein [Spirochaetaceae bacterium]|tara:strand:+ start:27057 stop:27350 length:294 start_codon:yes stop_codon:yes gene_type:complete
MKQIMRKTTLIIFFSALAVPVAGFALPVISPANTETRPMNTAECDYDVGDRVKVKWQGKWYPSEILKVKPDCSQYYIHYIDWSDSWDEWVSPDRIQK